MSNLNNITSKMLENAEAKKEQILATAQKEKQATLEKFEANGKNEEATILKKAKQDAEDKKERMISHATLEVRNNILQEKQEKIQDVFSSALEKLKQMDEATFSQFLKTAVEGSSFQGDIQLIFGSETPLKSVSDTVAEINKELTSTGKKIILNKEMKNNMSGFILEQNGIELNYSFEALVSSMKEELEFEVATILFQK